MGRRSGSFQKNYKTPGNAFRDLRLKLGLSQVDMAKKVGVGYRSWQRWEYGTRTPRLPYIIAICVACSEDFVNFLSKFRAASDELGLSIDAEIESAMLVSISEKGIIFE